MTDGWVLGSQGPVHNAAPLGPSSWQMRLLWQIKSRRHYLFTTDLARGEDIPSENRHSEATLVVFWLFVLLWLPPLVFHYVRTEMLPVRDGSTAVEKGFY